MLSGMASMIVIRAKKGGAADVTPNAVNWTDATEVGLARTNTQTISGINTAITLTITYTGTGRRALYYSLNGGFDLDITVQPASISVSNGDTLNFAMEGYRPPQTSTITVKNASDGDATLDTFTLTSE